MKITGGTPADGYVLTSDTGGLASWQTIGYPCKSTGAGIWNNCYGNNVLQSNTTGSGNTGIGENAL